MNEKPDPLWLHAYAGQENGLMVVGTPAALTSLGEQLVAAADSEEPATAAWPRSIAKPATAGPYKDIADFKLSFHVTAEPASLGKILPLQRHATPLATIVLVGVGFVVGAVTILRWVFRALF